MKNRDYKIFAAGQYYHVYNRGNAQQNIFTDADDYSDFLFLLKENLGLLKSRRASSAASAERYKRKLLPAGSFTIVCYCLMPNHFHLLLKQERELPVSKLISKLATSYSKRFNKKYQRVGHLFQDQFKSVVVETDSQLLWLTAYVHANPKVAGLVRKIADYQWSSYLEYLGRRRGVLVQPKVVLDQFSSLGEYKKFVEQASREIEKRKEFQNLLLD